MCAKPGSKKTWGFLSFSTAQVPHNADHPYRAYGNVVLSFNAAQEAAACAAAGTHPLMRPPMLAPDEVCHALLACFQQMLNDKRQWHALTSTEEACHALYIYTALSDDYQHRSIVTRAHAPTAGHRAGEQCGGGA